MKRIWSIEEQTIEDRSTGLRLEFSSVHTDEANAGNELPSRDDTLVLRLWTSDRQRMATFKLERNGKFVSAEIEPVGQQEGLPAVPETFPGSRVAGDEDGLTDGNGGEDARGEPVEAGIEGSQDIGVVKPFRYD